jgi:hypothetical protein
MTKKLAAKKTSRPVAKPAAKKAPSAKVAKPAKTPAPAPAKKSPAPAAPAPAPEKKAAAAKPEKQSRAGLAYRLIQEGKTNQEVWEALRAAFDMPEHHSYYPVWYRAKLVQLGTITKAFAQEHRGPAMVRKPAAAK